MSRQVDYQNKKLREGLCRQCGRRPVKKANSLSNRRHPIHCSECCAKMKQRHARNILERQRKKNIV